MTTTHSLKTDTSYFVAVAEGRKPFEIRYDDRGYQAGDRVLLREWEPKASCNCRDTQTTHRADCTRFTGRELAASIGYVAAGTPRRGGQPGFSGNGYVVFSLVDVTDVYTVDRPTAVEVPQLGEPSPLALARLTPPKAARP